MNVSAPPAAQEKWMREALCEARSARERGEIPVGAVVVRFCRERQNPDARKAPMFAPAAWDGEIIARTGNRVEEWRDPTAHAELLAVRAACASLGTRRLPECALFVTLEPCPMCAGLLAQCGLSFVTFGARDALAGCCGSVYDLTGDPALPYGATPVYGGVLAEECARMLLDFFKARRKRDA